MEIIKIQGQSGFFKGGTNTGIYVFESGNVLLIDAGHTVQRGKRLVKHLAKQSLSPAYVFTTHEHFDHFEAFEGIKEEIPSAQLISHYYAKPYIENLYLGMAYLSSSSIPSFFARRGNGLGQNPLESSRYHVDILVEDELVLEGKTFQIIHSPGHCAGQAAIITPDRVCYLGDIVMDNKIIDTYDMPFLFSIELQEESLNRIKTLDFDYGLIAHSKNPYTKDEIVEIAERNLSVIRRYEKDILTLLRQPMSREEILANLMVQNKVDCTYASYHYNNSTVGAFLAKLSHTGEIGYRYCDGRILYHLSGVENGV